MDKDLEQKIEEILTRGVAEVIDKEHLKKRLLSYNALSIERTMIGNNGYDLISLFDVLYHKNIHNDEYPSWSPDGTKIAFASDRDGNYEIYVMNADGTHQTRLTNNAAYDMSPAWSPDGTRIAFDTQRDHFPPAEVGIGPEFEIHVMNSDGSGDERLTNNNVEDRFPDWISNDAVIFSEGGQLIITHLTSLEPVYIVGNGTFPAWHKFDR